jgi:hypothetical protein
MKTFFIHVIDVVVLYMGLLAQLAQLFEIFPDWLGIASEGPLSIEIGSKACRNLGMAVEKPSKPCRTQC